MLLLYIACSLFAVTFCGSTSYTTQIARAQKWILSKGDKWNWDKDTPRVLIALALSDFDNRLEHQLAIKELHLQIATKFLQKNASMLIEEKMLFINSLLATCQNPLNFHGVNLASELRHTSSSRLYSSNWSNFALYLALCNSGVGLEWEKIAHLAQSVIKQDSLSPFNTESRALALLALKCCNDRHHYNHLDMKVRLEIGLEKILDAQLDDGSFGFLYTSAIATQVLMVYNSKEQDFSKQIDKSMKYLLKQQDKEGCFHDLMGTYLVLPILNKKTFLDLGNMSCTTPPPPQPPSPPTKRITLRLEYDDLILTINIPAYKNSTIIDILNIAYRKNKSFTFKTTTYPWGTYIDSIAGKVNDLEKGFYWTLSIVSSGSDERTISHTDDISKFIPRDPYYIIVYRYKKL